MREPRSTKNPSKIDPESSKLSTKSPSQRQHGPTWTALAPTQCSLNPSWAYPGENFPRNPDPNFAKDTPSHPKTPQTSILDDFWSLQIPIFIDFDAPRAHKSLYRNKTSTTQSHYQTNKTILAQWRGFAKHLDIYIYIYIYICVYIYICIAPEI